MKQKSWSPTLPPFRAFKKNVYLNTAKTSQFVYQLGEGNIIRSKSVPVDPDEILFPTFKKKVKYLKKCMLKFRKITGIGRGIAAVQVGIPERFAVIYMPDTQEKLLTIINPEITQRSSALLEFPEMCMSEGPIFAPVTRPAWIEFEYLDEQAKLQRWNTKDTTLPNRVYNRVFQHEIDHMDGIIFLDKADLTHLTLESDPKFYENATFTKVSKV